MLRAHELPGLYHDGLGCFCTTFQRPSGVGYPGIHTQENDTGPDGCNHAQLGSFILAASNNPLQGEVLGAHLLDMSPTLLELAGYDVPSSMQGVSLVHGKTIPAAADGLSTEGEELIRQRLRGLGYIA